MKLFPATQLNIVQSVIVANNKQQICDLSRENVPNGSRSSAERNGKRTGDERLGKPFKTGTVNGWTAN